MSEERIRKERDFHDERFSAKEDGREAVAKYYTIMERPKSLYRQLALDACVGGALLEYGCAIGSESKMWLDGGVNIIGIDISSEAISKAAAQWEGTQYADRASYLEMNAEAMTFEDAEFDVVVGNGIIHHLDLDACYGELARVLKPGGSAVFMEPLGHNPIINLFRTLTPAMRTDDEHPLKMQDIELAKKYFHRVESTSFHLSSLLAVPFRKTALFAPMLKSLHTLDEWLFKLPLLRRQAWFTVMHLSDPIKSN